MVPAVLIRYLSITGVNNKANSLDFNAAATGHLGKGPRKECYDSHRNMTGPSQMIGYFSRSTKMSHRAQVQSLADLVAASLVPLSVWKEVGLPSCLIPPEMTLELANRDICSPGKELQDDVFVSGWKVNIPAVLSF
ncbi:hypothetical protein Tco_0537116 [Tanacetum coccineum]